MKEAFANIVKAKLKLDNNGKVDQKPKAIDKVKDTNRLFNKPKVDEILFLEKKDKKKSIVLKIAILILGWTQKKYQLGLITVMFADGGD